jgi:type I restriction enzyme S subunit
MIWPVVALDRLAAIVGGSTPRRDEPRNWGPGHFWATPTDLPMPGEGIHVLERTAETITDEGLRSCSTNLLPIGAVLYSTRATIGKLAIANVPVATNQGFNNLIAGPNIYNRYLAYALQFLTPDISRLAGSTTFKEVSRSALRGFKIPVPPVSEQHRIVELLEEADRLRRLRREADTKVARILPALFLKMFEKPERWGHTEALGRLVTIKSGGTPSKTVPEFWRGPIPWVSPKDMKRDEINDAEDHISEAALQTSAAPLVPEDAVLIVVRGMILARDVPIAIARKPVSINQDMKALILADERMSPHFLFAALKVQAMRLLSEVTTAAHGTKKLETGRLENVPIPIPSPSALAKFSSAYEQLLAIDRQRTAIGPRIDELFSVLLQRAFSGQLTAKWREAHMRELLAEMEQQARALNLPLAQGVAS